MPQDAISRHDVKNTYVLDLFKPFHATDRFNVKQYFDGEVIKLKLTVPLNVVVVISWCPAVVCL